MAFAQGKEAYGICDITGFRYRRREMKKTWDGLIVGPDQWSPKHPQLDPKPTPVDSEDNNFFVVYTNVGDGILGAKLDTFEITSGVGEVTVTT